MQVPHHFLYLWTIIFLDFCRNDAAFGDLNSVSSKKPQTGIPSFDHKRRLRSKYSKSSSRPKFKRLLRSNVKPHLSVNSVVLSKSKLKNEKLLLAAAFVMRHAEPPIKQKVVCNGVQTDLNLLDTNQALTRTGFGQAEWVYNMKIIVINIKYNYVNEYIKRTFILHVPINVWCSLYTSKKGWICICILATDFNFPYLTLHYAPLVHRGQQNDSSQICLFV